MFVTNDSINLCDYFGLVEFEISPGFKAGIETSIAGSLTDLFGKNIISRKDIIRNIQSALPGYIWSKYTNSYGEKLQSKIIQIGSLYIAKLYNEMDENKQNCSGEFETKIDELNKKFDLGSFIFNKIIDLGGAVVGTPPVSGLPSIICEVRPDPIQIRWKCITKKN